MFTIIIVLIIIPRNFYSIVAKKKQKNLFVDIFFILEKNNTNLMQLFQIPLKRCYCWKDLFFVGKNKNKAHGNSYY